MWQLELFTNGSNRISFLVMIFSGRCRKPSSVYVLLFLALLQLISSTTGQEQSFLPSSSDPNDAAKNEGSDMYWCSDSACRGAISLGRTLVPYNAPTHRHLSFNTNQDIVILGKPVNDGDFWIGKVYRNGRAGLVPKRLVREERILNQKEKHDMSLDILLLFANQETIVNLDPPKVESEASAEKAEEATAEKVEATVEKAEPTEVIEEGEGGQEYASAEEVHEESQHEYDHHDHNHESHEHNEAGVEEHDHHSYQEEAVKLEIVPTPPGSSMYTQTQTQVPVDPQNTQAETKVEEATIAEAQSQSQEANEVEPNAPQASEAQVPPTAENEVHDEHESQHAHDGHGHSLGSHEHGEHEVNPPSTSDAEHSNDSRMVSEEVESAPAPSPATQAEAQPSQEDGRASHIDNNEQLGAHVENASMPATATEEAPIAEAHSEEAKPTETEAEQAPDVQIPTEEKTEVQAEDADAHDRLTPPQDEIPTSAPAEVAQEDDSDSLQEEVIESDTASTPAPVPVPQTETQPEPSGSIFSYFSQSDNKQAEAKSEEPVRETSSEAVPVPMPEPPAEEAPKLETVSAEAPAPVLETPPQEAKEAESSVEQAEAPAVQIPSGEKSESQREDAVTVSPAQEAQDYRENLFEYNHNHHGHDHDHFHHHHTHDHAHAHVHNDSVSAVTADPDLENSEASAVPSNVAPESVDPVESIAAEDEATEDSSSKNNSFVIVVKYLSSTLLSFLPEHLQDTILDVNDALVFTGIIVLLIIGVCVPYFFVETFLSSRPLKKKVVDLNKALWKVSAAYESQQDEFDMFKKKAFAYDECLSKIEKLETQLELKKSIDHKQKLEIQHLKEEGKKRARLESEVNSLVQTTMSDLAKTKEERNKYVSVVASLKKSLKEATEDLETIQAELNSKTMDLELLTSTKEFTENRVKASENEIGELKSKLTSEITLRREAQDKVDELERVRKSLQEELSELRKITLQYEETVNNLTTEISLKENELFALKDSLGDDSPLVEIAEIKAKLAIAEEESKSLQSRIDSITLENKTLSRNYEESSSALVSITAEKDEAQKRLHVLEAYFKEKEEELRRIVEKQQVEQEIRGKDKNELIALIQEKTSEINDLNERIEQLKLEFEETKNQHRNELRAKDQKNHEQWLALCQSERKVKDAKEEADSYRLKLTQIAKERGDENDTLMDGEEFFPVVPPPPIDEVPVSYFGLGFEPPLPLDDDEMNGESGHMSSGGFEPNRPNPVGSISGDSESDDVTDISPIVDHDPGRGRRGDFSDGSASPTGRPLSRDNWMNGTSGRVNYNNNNKKNAANNNRTGTDQRLRHPNQHGPQSASSPINEHSSLC